MIFKFTIVKFITIGESTNYPADFEVYINDKNLRNAEKQLKPLFLILEKKGYRKERVNLTNLFLLKYIKKHKTWMEGYNILYTIKSSSLNYIIRNVKSLEE